MKILWVKSDFLHPTTRGGQIRTLEMVRRLHRRHEVHYVAFHDPAEPEGLARSGEYSTRAYPIEHSAPPRGSLKFAMQVASGLFSSEPVSIARYRSSAMRDVIDRLASSERFDAIVCDFLTPAVNIPELHEVVLFQHNVECMIWERHATTASTRVARAYLGLQAKRMAAFEEHVCRSVRRVIAVSEADAQVMTGRFGIRDVWPVPTGVDVDYFAQKTPGPRTTDLIFLGSMDWLPNIDGITFFVASVLPLIRRERPDCSLAIVGRKPPPEISDLAKQDRHIVVTGTVPDVRPFLWRAQVSVVPLRIGGGTRLKIYESIAAGTPVVSTTIGAEGLQLSNPDEIRFADSPEALAQNCLALLNDSSLRQQMSEAGLQKVASHFSWDRVVQDFETVLTPSARRS